MAGRRIRRATKTKTNPLAVLAVILLAVVLVLGGVLVMKLAERGLEAQQTREAAQTQDEEPEDTVTVGGQQVEIDRSLPQSDLQAEHFTTNEDGTITYDGAARDGIDVSSHQGEIDWTAVKADGVEFSILRIGYRGYSEGALNFDQQFETNYAGATENGIDVGVYFFSQAIDEVEALQEAKQVVKWLDGKEIDGPVVYDWEHITHDTTRTDEVTGETVTACAKIFCQEIQSAGYEAMIYCNGMLGYLSYDLNELTDIPIWYAEYSEHPSYAYETTIWQYTDSGSVDGIQGSVDRNIWFRDGDG